MADSLTVFLMAYASWISKAGAGGECGNVRIKIIKPQQTITYEWHIYTPGKKHARFLLHFLGRNWVINMKFISSPDQTFDAREISHIPSCYRDFVSI